MVHPDRTRILKERPANGSPAVTNAILGFEGSAEGVSSTGNDTIYSSQLAEVGAVGAHRGGAEGGSVRAARRRAAPRLDRHRRRDPRADPARMVHRLVPAGPLRHLSASIAGLREGEGDFVPIPVRRADEVGDLTTRFNLMMYDRMVAEKARAASEAAAAAAGRQHARAHLLRRREPARGIREFSATGNGSASTRRRWWASAWTRSSTRRATSSRISSSASRSREKPRRSSARWAREAALRIVRTSFYPQFGDGGMVVGIYHMSTDISEDRKVQAELDALARRDPLTGLYNRRSFEELLPQAVARATRNDRRLALLFVDLDRFKAVNDKQGPRRGRRCAEGGGEAPVDLRAAVRYCGAAGRRRIRGDPRGPQRARRCRSSSRRRSSPPSASPSRRAAGTARSARASASRCATGKDEDCSDLLKRADTAHYAAKGAGRGRFHLDIAAE